MGGFLGSPSMNFIKSEIKDNKITVNNSSFELNNEQKDKLKDKKEVLIGIRSEHFNPKNSNFEFNCPVEISEMLGSEKIAYLTANSETICATLPVDFEINKTIDLSLNTDNLMFFDVETGVKI